VGARWEDIKEGSEPKPMVVGPLSVTDAVRYQGASGDMNPIHHDVDFARGAGFEKLLMVGMFQTGVLNTWATNWLGPENVRRTKCRWKRPVSPGDILTFSGKVDRKYEDEGEQKVDLDLACTNQEGEVVVQAWMTFVVPADCGI
jgi:acyl dehydratase